MVLAGAPVADGSRALWPVPAPAKTTDASIDEPGGVHGEFEDAVVGEVVAS